MPAAPDAGTGDAMAPPAPPTTSVPSWASSLVGRYAVQTVVFGTSSQNSKSITRQQELAIAEVRGEGAEMRLRLKLCASHTENALGTVDLLQPEAYPEIERRVVFDGTTWGTDDGPLAIGYTRAPSAECVANPGGLFPKVAAQSWLESTCRCPLNEGTVPLFDDCRVSDPDGDGKPGLSYRVDIRGFVLPPMRQGMYNLYVAFSERTHFTQGRVDAAGVPTATVRSDSVFTQLGVDPSTGLGDFSRGGKPCDASFNRASFVRLAGEREGWTCAELRKQEATLYPSSRPSPSSCFAVSVTDDPER